MKREFLKGLELSDDIIDNIMKEYGKSTKKLTDSIDTLNSKNSELLTDLVDSKKKYSDLEKDLTAANTKIADFEKIDIEVLRKESKDWEDKYNKRELDIKIDKFMDGYKFTSDLARKATLTEIQSQGFKIDKDGELKGAKEFMEKFIENNKTAFVTEDNSGSGTKDPEQANANSQQSSTSPYSYTPNGGGTNDVSDFSALLGELSKIN